MFRASEKFSFWAIEASTLLMLPVPLNSYDPAITTDDVPTSRRSISISKLSMLGCLWHDIKSPANTTTDKVHLKKFLILFDFNKFVISTMFVFQLAKVL